MARRNAESEERAFRAFLAEAEMLRTELRQSIELIRRIAMYATYVAGFALPTIAGFLSTKDGGTAISSWNTLWVAAEKSHFVIQFICLGVSLICFALLRIYIASFQQIFTIAKYFREYLIPSINSLTPGVEMEVLHWENWLRRNRRAKASFIGDVALLAHPLLIVTYSIAYCAAFVTIAAVFKSMLWPSAVIGFMIAALLIYSFLRIIRTLKQAQT